MPTTTMKPRLLSLAITLLAASIPLWMQAQNNLVENGAFENGQQIPSWHYREIYKENAIAVIDINKPYRGKSSLKLSMPLSGKLAGFEQQVQLQFCADPRNLKISLAVKVDSSSSADAFIDFYQHGKWVSLEYFNLAYFINNYWKIYENHVYVPAGVDSATINLVTFGAGTAWFDEIKIEEAKKYKKPTAIVTKVVNNALQFAKDNYWKRDSVDWQSVEEQTVFMASGTGKNYYPAIKTLLQSLNDPHAYLQTAEVKQAISAKEPNAPEVKPDFPWVSLLDSSYGYIHVSHCSTLNPYQKKLYADTLLSQIRMLDSAQDLKGWMVDLRDNTGGFYDPMLAGLSPILDAGFVVSLLHLEKERYNQQDSIFIPSNGKWPHFSVEPYWAKKTIPVAVLSGPGTASSGEIVLIAFKNRPGIQIFGKPSAGVPTGPIPFYLPDKGSFAITGALWCDKTGVCYSESLHPDVIVENPQHERQLDKDPVVKAAKEWLHNCSVSKFK